MMRKILKLLAVRRWRMRALIRREWYEVVKWAQPSLNDCRQRRRRRRLYQCMIKHQKFIYLNFTKSKRAKTVPLSQMQVLRIMCFLSSLETCTARDTGNTSLEGNGNNFLMVDMPLTVRVCFILGDYKSSYCFLVTIFSALVW